MSEQVEQYDEVCQVCGASMGATHAPWCEFPDGTPMPGDMQAMAKAEERAKQAVYTMIQNAPDYEALMWAMGSLFDSLGEMLRTVTTIMAEAKEMRVQLIPFLQAVWEKTECNPVGMAKSLEDNLLLEPYFTMDSPEVQAVMAGKA